jgi:hypothetical protein
MAEYKIEYQKIDQARSFPIPTWSEKFEKIDDEWLWIWKQDPKWSFPLQEVRDNYKLALQCSRDILDIFTEAAERTKREISLKHKCPNFNLTEIEAGETGAEFCRCFPECENRHEKAEKLEEHIYTWSELLCTTIGV